MLHRLWPAQPILDLTPPEIPLASSLHLAGHGLFDPRDPSLARVWLGPEQSLGFHEVLACPAVPPVVFLAACVVGRTGEDLLEGDPLGLVGALFLRGARYVIGALQPVADLLMPVLVTLFYQAWWAEGLSPVRALGEAKRRLIHGDWYSDTEAIPRTSYPVVMQQPWLARVVAQGSDEELFFQVLEGCPDLLAKETQTRIWALEEGLLDAPNPLQRAVGALLEEAAVRTELEGIRSELRHPTRQEAVVRGVVDWLVAERARLPVEGLVSGVRGFGRGDIS